MRSARRHPRDFGTRRLRLRYPGVMSAVTSSSLALRELIDAHRDELDTVLRRYGATNPRLFGSVARGDATPVSDIDVLVDLLPDPSHSRLLRLSGVAAGFEAVLQREVDVVAAELLREQVSGTALVDAVPL